MFSQKHNQQTVGVQGTSPYTNVPTGAGVNGGTANYPVNQKTSGQKVGYGYDKSDVNAPGGYVNAPGSYPASQKAGYEAPGSYKTGYADSNVVHPHLQPNGVDGGYVHQTPVSYGPDGTPVVVTKKRNRLRNVIVGTLAVCCCCVAL